MTEEAKGQERKAEQQEMEVDSPVVTQVHPSAMQLQPPVMTDQGQNAQPQPMSVPGPTAYGQALMPPTHVHPPVAPSYMGQMGWGLPAVAPPTIPRFEGAGLETFIMTVRDFFAVTKLQGNEERLGVLWRNLSEEVRFRCFICEARPQGSRPDFEGLVGFLTMLYAGQEKQYSAEDLNIVWKTDGETFESHAASFMSLVARIRMKGAVDETTACEKFFMSLPDELGVAISKVTETQDAETLDKLVTLARQLNGVRKGNRYASLIEARGIATKKQAPPPSSPMPMLDEFDGPPPRGPPRGNYNARYPGPGYQPQGGIDNYASYRPPTKFCIYCAENDHTKRYCPVMNDHIKKNWIVLEGPQSRAVSKKSGIEHPVGRNGIREYVEKEWNEENRGPERESKMEPKYVTRAIRVELPQEPQGPQDAEKYQTYRAETGKPTPTIEERKIGRFHPSDDVRKKGGPEESMVENRFETPPAPAMSRHNPAMQQLAETVLNTTFAVPGSALFAGTSVLRSLNALVRTKRMENDPTTTYASACGMLGAMDPDADDGYAEELLFHVKHARVDPRGENMTAATCGQLEIGVGSQLLMTQLDSGSEINLLGLHKAYSLGLQPKILRNTAAFGISDTPLQLIGKCEGVEIDVGGIRGKVVFFIAEHLDVAILGRPFERAFQAHHDTDSAGNQFSTFYSAGKETIRRVQTAEAGHKRHANHGPTGTPSPFPPPSPLTHSEPASNQPGTTQDLPEAVKCDVPREVNPEDELEGSVFNGNEENREWGEVRKVNKSNDDMEDDSGWSEARSAIEESDGEGSLAEWAAAEEVEVYWCQTLRKKVADKIRPANVALQGQNPQSAPSGQEEWAWVKRLPDRPELNDAELALLRFGDQVTKQERELFIEMLQEQRRALSFGWKDLGCLDPRIEVPVKLNTVPHEPWCLKPIRFSQQEHEAIIALLKERMEAGIIERSQGPYSSRFFLIRKN
jgi:hypothetical protein